MLTVWFLMNIHHHFLLDEYSFLSHLFCICTIPFLPLVYREGVYFPAFLCDCYLPLWVFFYIVGHGVFVVFVKCMVWFQFFLFIVMFILWVFFVCFFGNGVYSLHHCVLCLYIFYSRVGFYRCHVLECVKFVIIYKWKKRSSIQTLIVVSYIIICVFWHIGQTCFGSQVISLSDSSAQNY